MRTIKITDENLFHDYLDLRRKVFVEEQHVDINIEIDHYDKLDNPIVDHFAFMVKDMVIGTCRGLKTQSNRVQLGRFCIHPVIRHQGFGLKLLRSVETYYYKQGISSVFLHAQLRALPFYKQAGYSVYGEVFDDAGIDHISCQKILIPSFYDQIAKYYDLIFPLTEAKKQFLSSVFHDSHHLLDVGCASGLIMKYLKEECKKDVFGIDLSEDMIIQAQEKNLDVLKLDMLQIDKLEQSFDAIYCLGNTLAHLDGSSYIKQFLSLSYQKINENGLLVIQIVNYDKIIQEKITSLPTIKSNKPHLEFIRNYEYVNGRINFKTVLYHQKHKYENSQQLYPLTSDELTTLCHQEGFEIIKSYGSYKKEEYNPLESDAYIIIARKKEDFYE